MRDQVRDLLSELEARYVFAQRIGGVAHEAIEDGTGTVPPGYKLDMPSMFWVPQYACMDEN